MNSRITPLTLHDRGHGQTVLLLHGGAGPLSVIPFADRLVDAGDIRAIVPTHPGFSDTPRSAAMRTPADLADRYVTLLDELDLHEVTIVGFSIGGWIASELALRLSPRVTRMILVDGVGIAVDGHPIADVSQLSPAEISAISYHDPSLAPDPATLSDAQRAETAGNIAAVVSYGASMIDVGLRPRLAEVTIPTLVIWGESDGIADADYGRAYADAFANAGFELLARAGHVPQIEQPDALANSILTFVKGDA